MIAQTPKFDFTLDFMEPADHDKIKACVKSLSLIDSSLKQNLEDKFS